MDRSISPLIVSKTAAEWTAQDPYLSRGDCGVESDTGKVKVGLGATWSQTSYLPVPSAPTVPDAPIIVDSNSGDNFILFYPPTNDGGSPILGYKFHYREEPVSEAFPLPNDASTLVTESTNGTLTPRPDEFKAYLKWQNYNIVDVPVSVAAYNAVGVGPKSRPVRLYGV